MVNGRYEHPLIVIPRGVLVNTPRPICSDATKKPKGLEWEYHVTAADAGEAPLALLVACGPAQQRFKLCLGRHVMLRLRDVLRRSSWTTSSKSPLRCGNCHGWRGSAFIANALPVLRFGIQRRPTASMRWRRT